MKFYGRKQEKKLLNKMFSSESMQTAMLYGRRRVGKSELIKNALKNQDIKSIYYECKETTEMNNVDSLSGIIADIFGFPKPSFNSLEELIRYIFQYSVKEPVIFVLDEYPYIKNAVKGLDSILQSIIDEYRNAAKIKFVICGSYVDIMKSLLDSSNPLYGRIDRTINLKAMDYKEASEFYEGFSCEDKVRLYSVFGGIPYYNRLIDSSLSVKENIIELIASPGARLENEVSMYLKSEINKIANANELIEALAKGYSRFGDILSQSHVSSSPTLVDVLDKLIKMEVVSKISPINDENNKRKTGYYISDQLSLFYYRYCFRYSSQMMIMNSDVFYDRFIKEDFETWYVPLEFETICRQYLIAENREGKLEEPFFKIGKYWYDDPETRTNGEFDLVTMDKKGYIFYEVKFRGEPVSGKMIEREISQVQKTGLVCYKYGFISRSGFKNITVDKEKLILIKLEDLFE